MNRALNPLKIAKKVIVAQNTCSLADKDIKPGTRQEVCEGKYLGHLTI